MYIHRRWLVETIIKHQDDPSKSRSWQSVVAAYESAATLTDDMRRLWLVYPRLIDRMAPFWSHTQTAALLLCALVTHIPRCDFTPEALRHVDETCEMFAEAKESLQPSNALVRCTTLPAPLRDADSRSAGISTEAPASSALCVRQVA